MGDICSYIIRPPFEMKREDHLWIIFENIDRADIWMAVGEVGSFRWIDEDNEYIVDEG